VTNKKKGRQEPAQRYRRNKQDLKSTYSTLLNTGKEFGLQIQSIRHDLRSLIN
jgi:hypothetical protein